MRRRRPHEEEDASFWVSFSDVATALLMAFLLIVVLLMQQQQKESEKNRTQNEKIKGQIEPYVNIRKGLIEELGRELKKKSLGVEVDRNTGEVKLPVKILFDVDKAELKDEGKAWLREFMPQYFGVLLNEKYKDSVSKIEIAGHADSSGTYEYNMRLTYDRANSVWGFFLANPPVNLTPVQISRWKNLVSVNGRSNVELVRNGGGTVNNEQSRRVTFKFGLKEDQMIDQMIDALNLNDKH